MEVIETDGPLVPDYSDFLFGYATPQNYVSYRNKSMGTFYIEVLTRVLNEEAGRYSIERVSTVLPSGKLLHLSCAQTKPKANPSL